MHRRTLLRRTAAATAGAAGLAGCLGGGVDPPAQVSRYDVRTTATACDSGDSGEASVAFDGEAGVVTVEGAIEASDPCHEAAIRRSRVDSGELRLGIVTDPDGQDACVDCVGVLQYTATVAFRRGLPNAVVVLHGEGQTEVTRVER